MSADPFAEYRPLLLEEMQRIVDEVSLHHGALMRQKLEPAGEQDVSLLPGLLCLATAETISGRADAAFPAAIALSLLATMAEVFGAVAGGADDDGLIHAWGLPRTLNAGDAFFALAQETLAGAAGLDETRRLQAVALLDEACLQVSETLYGEARGARAEPGRGMVGAALALGALAAGSADSIVRSLAAFDISQNVNITAALPSAEREKLMAAVSFVREAGK
jgi:hypothetical protein